VKDSLLKLFSADNFRCNDTFRCVCVCGEKFSAPHSRFQNTGT